MKEGLQCLESEVACKDGSKCIPLSWKCDYSPDCLDHSDEPPDCPEAYCGSFRCNVTHKCLPQGWVCDGEADCGAGDTSDEDSATCKKGNTCPLNYYRCKDDITCVLLRRLCDRSLDCPDGSDEGQFCNNTSQCQGHLCSYGCTPTDKGPQCYCGNGQQPNKTACVDANECEVEGTCDQICINSKDKFECKCASGYQLRDKYSCTAINVPPDQPATLLYASNSGLARLHLNGTSLPGDSMLNFHYAVTLDFDHRNNSVCWVSSNSSWSVFQCASADNLTASWVMPQPFQNGLSHVNDLARDWVTGNWYVLDRREVIFLCNSTMQVCITLIDVMVNEPRGIALDPSAGYMFFTNWGTTHPKLDRALMDGSQQIPLVRTKIVYPFGIAVDYPNRHVYWVDGYLSHVERVDYNGENRRIIVRLSTDERPYGISLFENFLYVTSWKDDSIKRVARLPTNLNRQGPSQPIISIHTNLTEPMHIHVFHRQRQPSVNHPCGRYNGGCQHLCIPLWKDDRPAPSCRCQPGHVLGPRGTCVVERPEAFLIYAKGRPGMIKGVGLDGPGAEEVMIPVTSLTRPTTLDYDVRSQFIYYADIQRFVIERQSLNGRKKEQVVTSAVLNVEGLAVDWMGRNIYWTDEGVSSIFVCSMEDPVKRKMLLYGNLTNARAIVLNPRDGYMYWTVWQFTIGGAIASGDALIERAWMDGRNREPFITSNLQWPNGLTIDFKEGWLYWCDGFHNKIERVKLNGEGREVVLQGDILSHPYGLAYHNGFIYWSEFQNGTIKRVKLRDPGTPEELRVENPYIFDLKVFTNDSQSDGNDCTTGVLRCEDLCLSTPNGPICACATGSNPDPAQSNLCQRITNFTQPSLCSEGQFQCKKTLRCIDKRYLCDGDNDCLDNSDEDTSSGGVCEAVECLESMFQCGNNKCIDQYWVCDGDQDCEDGSDESHDECNQPHCPTDKFRCKVSGRCIPKSWVCDIDKDCGPGDDSDEHTSCNYPECGVEDFQCANKRCVPTFYVCDGDDDCRDRSDEKHCGDICTNTSNPLSSTARVCSSHCREIPDQASCEVTRGCTPCHNNNSTGSNCVATYQICDGSLDCPDGSDELNCEDKIKTSARSCESGEFTCLRTRDCIPLQLKCDGSEDCLDMSDEQGCENVTCSDSEWKCASGKQCVPIAWQCDGEVDCEDSSDEADCANTKPKCHAPSLSCDNNTRCISPEVFCDGYEHCHDGSDEGGRCDAEDCELMDCEKSCSQSPTGPVCTCPSGQTLLEDGRGCSSIHPCQQWGTCSQNCVSTLHSYKCTCIQGYQLEPDGFTCKSDDGATPYLIFSNRHELRSISLKRSEGESETNMKALITSLKNTIALDFYHSSVGDVIFWTDVVDDKIYRGTLMAGALSNIEVVVQTGLATAEGLAVDWLAENLYWVESNLDQIEVAKLNGSYRRTLVSGAMASPRAISLDPRLGIMFWTDWEENKARIESCSMSGEGRRVVISVNESTQGYGGWPNGLTLDYALKRIYWIDAKADSIHTSLYDGSDPREVLREHNHLSHPFAISLFGNYVYWTDWRTNSVIRANKFDGSEVTDIQRTVTQPFDIQVLHPSRQPRDGPNPCQENNGGCSHLCLLSFNGTRQCNCPHVMSLGSSNTTCKRKEKVLVFSRNQEVRGVDLSQPKHDIIPRLTAPKVQYALQLDYYAAEKMIYWPDTKLNEVRRAKLSGTPVEAVVDVVLRAPSALAIDWLSGNMFITSVLPPAIMAATLDGHFLTKLMYEGLKQPLSLAVDPYNGEIYWSDIGEEHQIRWAFMGSNESELVSSQSTNNLLQYPTSLAYDPPSQHLFWVNRDSNSIQYYDLDSSKVITLLQPGDETSPAHPRALAVYKDYIYFADDSDSRVYKVSKTSGKNREVVRSGLSGVLALRVYDMDLQDGSNSCTQASPPCAHLCLPKNSVEHLCVCAAGYTKDPTNPSACVSQDGVLVFASGAGLGGLLVDNPFNPDGSPHDSLTPLSGVGAATRIDFHGRQDLLVWADGDLGSIMAVGRDGTGRRVIKAGATEVAGMAVDWVSNIVYWTDPVNDVIEVVHLSRSDQYVIVAEGLDQPGAIAIHPGAGMFFWADTGQEARIERAGLDGSNRSVVAAGLQHPADITVDYQSGLLYWVDRRAATLEKAAFDGSGRIVVMNTDDLRSPVAVFVFNNYIIWADTMYGGGSIRMVDKNLTRKSTLRQGLGESLSDLVVVGGEGTQMGINPCGYNNGGCEQLCLFTGKRVQCRCHHSRLAPDGTSCIDYDAFLMYSSVVSIESVHMFDDGNPNSPLKPITSDLMQNAISLTFDYSSRRLYYSDIQRGSINTVFFNGTGHKILTERQGSVEGLAFEEKERDLYWTCQTDATINRMSVDPKRKKLPEKIVHLDPADNPRGIVVDSCDLQIYWTNWNAEAPSIQRSLLSGIRIESIVTTHIWMPNGLALDHKAQKLYWGDARLDKIERCNLDGSDRVVLLRNVASHPFDLAVYGDHLFWTDWVLQAVVRTDKYTAGEVVKLRTSNTRVMGIVAVANDTNACDASPCRVLNGMCEDICTLDERAQVVCHCSPGRTLLPDGRRCAVRVANCSQDQFECSSGFCIPYVYSCDGVAECPDSSDEDEQYCVIRECREGYFSCGNGQCVPQAAVCNRKANCPNFRDESDCECDEHEIRCKTSGLCISAHLRCDFDPDCPDASDEMDCPKPDCVSYTRIGYNSSELINCVNTTNCILPKWICDGTNDCWDNSDEQNCTTITEPAGNSSCPEGTHQCLNGHCVAPLFICDGEDDCQDGENDTPSTDELNCTYTCPQDQFTCNDGNCIPNTWRCDAHEDCPDGSDEPDDCETMVCEHEYKCNGSGRCIPHEWVCDGDEDCVGGDDERSPKGCPLPILITCPPGHFTCPLLQTFEEKCVPLEFYCDGVEDCWDGSDEPSSCPTPSLHPSPCPEGQFQCRDSLTCIPKVWHCDGKDDCSNGSDEDNCIWSKSECPETNRAWSCGKLVRLAGWLADLT
ncbi:hypothetical protein Pcinc_039590 [Petrolisthes cinctipes]|uniref:EGF-like domain-containing protein n=1 Tax=Petrolisthes cinctipes TaxID=88211 RepID=A0AAE1EKF4_PETCI|nr:hypothetical protein Pcinc_039590 [Petrolisthes cinctipes]